MNVLEKLMYVNRDVFKCKRWDFDYWLYDFESISYIPHKWDETLSYWQNGIGHGDDLKVLVDKKVNLSSTRNLIIVSVMLIVGIGGALIPIHGAAKITATALSAILGIILNVILPKDQEQAK